jgi:hypothetical protein
MQKEEQKDIQDETADQDQSFVEHTQIRNKFE